MPPPAFEGGSIGYYNPTLFDPWKLTTRRRRSAAPPDLSLFERSYGTVLTYFLMLIFYTEQHCCKLQSFRYDCGPGKEFYGIGSVPQIGTAEHLQFISSANWSIPRSYLEQNISCNWNKQWVPEPIFDPCLRKCYKSLVKKPCLLDRL